MNFLESVIAYSNGEDLEEDKYSIQAAAMGCYLVILCMAIQMGNNHLDSLKSGLQLSITQIAHSRENLSEKGIMELRSVTLPFFERIFILNPQETLSFACAHMSTDLFMDRMVASMDYLNNSSVRKLNLLVICRLLEIVTPSALIPVFESFLRHAIPEVRRAEEAAVQPERKVQKNRKGEYSQRRESFQQTISPSTHNLVQEWRQALRHFEERIRTAGLTLPPLSDPGLQEQVLVYLK